MPLTTIHVMFFFIFFLSINLKEALMKQLVKILFLVSITIPTASVRAIQGPCDPSAAGSISIWVNCISNHIGQLVAKNKKQDAQIQLLKKDKQQLLRKQSGMKELAAENQRQKAQIQALQKDRQKFRQQLQQAERAITKYFTKSQKASTALTKRVAQLQKANTAMTKRFTKLEGTGTDSNLLTFSSFVELDKKAIIKQGEEWTAPNANSTFRRGPFRIALWVNVAGHSENTQSTMINISHYNRGQNKWYKDSQIGDWKLLGRDWEDNYLDLNISKVGDKTTSFPWFRNFKLKNVGKKTLEIFAYGVIQGQSGHIQR